MSYFRNINPDNASRREFLKRSAALSIAATATPWALTLAAMGEAAAATSAGYKALVCVFLYGGNDYANTLIPYDLTSYNLQQTFRSNLAISNASLTPLVLNPVTPLPNAQQYALAPGLDTLLPIFNAGKMSVLLNVGTLIEPTTKAQYSAKSVPLPPKLFSHIDQQSFWQSSQPQGAASGWGGRMGDLLVSGNGNATFTCISVSGNAVLLSGKTVQQYQLSTSGSIPVTGLTGTTPKLFGSSACSTVLQNLMTAPSSQLFENEYARVNNRSITANSEVTSALATVSLTTVFPTGNTLADQLKIVAKMIASGSTLGATRQVFFVSISGFDTHDSLLAVHPGLMTTVGSALSAFYQATVDLGVANQVTTFTASDFGRTLVSNNDGSDHGWGSHHFVMGGSVVGQSFFGTPPVLANGGPDDVGQGRLLPTISVDQYAATLAKWFGVSATDMPTVLPNIGNYSVTDLSFLV